MSESPADAKDFSEFSNQFLKTHSHLFTVFGVFGAIAVYLSTISTELPANYPNLAIDIGIFSSLSIFVSIGYLINRMYRQKYKNFRGIRISFPQIGNFIPCLLLIFFNGLVVSILFIVITHILNSWIRYLSGSIFLAGFYISFIIMIWLSSTIENAVDYPFVTIVICTAFAIAMVFLAIELILQAMVYPALSSPIRRILTNLFLSVYGSGTFIVIYLAFVYDDD